MSNALRSRGFRNRVEEQTLQEATGINDAGTGLTDCWSASKIQAEIDAGDALKADLVHTHVEADITDLAHLQIDDVTPSGTTVYSSNKVVADLATKSNTGHTHVEADITDLAHLQIDDVTPSGTTVYSSNKVDSELSGKANTSHTHVEADITDLAHLQIDDVTPSASTVYSSNKVESLLPVATLIRSGGTGVTASLNNNVNGADNSINWGDAPTVTQVNGGAVTVSGTTVSFIESAPTSKAYRISFACEIQDAELTLGGEPDVRANRIDFEVRFGEMDSFIIGAQLGSSYAFTGLNQAYTANFIIPAGQPSFGTFEVHAQSTAKSPNTGTGVSTMTVNFNSLASTRFFCHIEALAE